MTHCRPGVGQLKSELWIKKKSHINSQIYFELCPICDAIKEAVGFHQNVSESDCSVF